MSLPIDSILPTLLRLLTRHSSVVLQAPPGTGKTTRVPLALLNANFLNNKRIVMLEPRRIAARSAARFMAQLLHEPVGKTVGYRTRLDTQISAHTKIEVVTEGILSRLLQDDAALSNYGVVIFDEFHERSLQGDVGLALVRQCQQILRDDLRVIVMSATLDAQNMSRVLGGECEPVSADAEKIIPLKNQQNVPVLSCVGQMFPVEVRYRPAPAAGARVLQQGRDTLTDFVAQIIREVIQQDTGSVLVFLPGEGEIKRVLTALEHNFSESILIAPLFGQLSAEEQDRAISAAPSGMRKIVLATAIAETSLTIEGIRVVIDAGLMRVAQFDANSAMTRLVTQRVSAANAEQRRGRAGRVSAGVCIRLWSEDEQKRLAKFAEPEILTADLTGTVLELAQWGVSNPAELHWLDLPPPAHWAQARDLLQQLNALDKNSRITPHGKKMARLSLPARLGNMVLRGRELGLGEQAAELAALLAERDMLPRSHSGADLHDRLAVLRGEQHISGVDKNRLRAARDSVKRLMTAAENAAESAAEKNKNTKDTNQSDCKKISAQKNNHDYFSAGLLLALAFPDHIAQRRAGGDARYRLSNGRGAYLPNDDRLAREPWLVAAELDGKSQEAKIFLAAAVSPAELHTALPELIIEAEAAVWDASTQSVSATKKISLGALVLEEKSATKISDEKINAVLCAAITDAGVQIFPWTPALRQWQARVLCMRALEEKNTGECSVATKNERAEKNTDANKSWPDVSDAALLKNIAQWAAPFFNGASRFSHLQKFPLHDALLAQLDWALQKKLDHALPTHLSVPTGSLIALDYTAEYGPVLAVKLQEMFGQLSTPTLAGGRLPLTVHLLSPAQKPVAVTQDLASFWKNAYSEVRKDLRGRYPRHPWPEDPFTAVAQRGVKHPRK